LRIGVSRAAACSARLARTSIVPPPVVGNLVVWILLARVVPGVVLAIVGLLLHLLELVVHLLELVVHLVELVTLCRRIVCVLGLLVISRLGLDRCGGAFLGNGDQRHTRWLAVLGGVVTRSRWVVPSRLRRRRGRLREARKGRRRSSIDRHRAFCARVVRDSLCSCLL